MTHMSSHTYHVKRLETVFKLLAEPNRLRILYSLGLECRPVTQIVKDTGLSQTNVSFHLRLLREAGLVRPERRGAFIYYCLPDAELLEILEGFGDWVERRSVEAPIKPKAGKTAAGLTKELGSEDSPLSQAMPQRKRSEGDGVRKRRQPRKSSARTFSP
jgi:ArsR family transcriptional regulator, arsenate/arsenite/antimonite-responsive transcriptional repressor